MARTLFLVGAMRGRRGGIVTTRSTDRNKMLDVELLCKQFRCLSHQGLAELIDLRDEQHSYRLVLSIIAYRRIRAQLVRLR